LQGLKSITRTLYARYTRSSHWQDDGSSNTSRKTFPHAHNATFPVSDNRRGKEADRSSNDSLRDRFQTGALHAALSDADATAWLAWLTTRSNESTVEKAENTSSGTATKRWTVHTNPALKSLGFFVEKKASISGSAPE
jgi:hypothetical protein